MLGVLFNVFLNLLFTTHAEIVFDEDFIVPGIADDYLATFNSDATEFFVLGRGGNNILQYAYNPISSNWEVKNSIFSAKPTSISWQDSTNSLVTINSTHIKVIKWPFTAESLTQSYSNAQTNTYLASSSKLTAVCRSKEVFIYLNPPYQLLKYTLCNDCKGLAATDSWVIVDTPDCKFKPNDQSKDYVSLIDCTGTCKALATDELNWDPNSVEIAYPFYFVGRTASNDNNGAVEIYKKGSTSWSFNKDFQGNSDDQLGKFLDVTKEGDFLAAYAADPEEITVYDKDLFSQWNKHTTIDSVYIRYLGRVAQNMQIRKSKWGYLLLLSVSSTESAGVLVINVTCSSGNYGSDCNIPCNCGHGTCNSTMWSNGNCIYCNPTYYGTNCNTLCACSHGKCNNSITGNGKCLYCDPNYFGTNCIDRCTCQNGVCNENIAGNGKCLSCIGKYYGPDCNKSCSCMNGSCISGINGTGLCSACVKSYYLSNCSQQCVNCISCSDGIFGNGTCFNCPPDRYGESCLPCHCKNGECSNDNGHCLSCNDTTHYGPDCDQLCKCKNGECDSDIDGTGNCIKCNPGYYGTYCEFQSLCDKNYGKPNDGQLGTAECASCNETHFGPYCNQSCLCSDISNCDSDIHGTGICKSCPSDKFGPICSETCTCQNGTCDSGINGTGQCKYCENNYFGINCELHCICPNGTCTYNQATNSFSGCTCNQGYSLNLSDMKTCITCVDRVSCTYGSYIISDMISLNVSLIEIGNLIVSSSKVSLSSTNTNDIEIEQSTVTVIDGSLVYINGNMHSVSSVINLSHSSMHIEGNAYLSDTILRLSSNSSLTISGCIDSDNITFDLDYDSYKFHRQTNLTLLTFADDCQTLPNVDIIGHYSLGDCATTTATPTIEKNSVVVIMNRDYSHCRSEANELIPFWGLVTIITLSSLIALVITATLIGLIVPKVKHQLFPFRDQVPEYTL